MFVRLFVSRLVVRYKENLPAFPFRPQGRQMESTKSDRSESDTSDIRFRLLGPHFEPFVGVEKPLRPWLPLLSWHASHPDRFWTAPGPEAGEIEENLPISESDENIQDIFKTSTKVDGLLLFSPVWPPMK